MRTEDGHERPFFAPIAALISLGITHNQRLRRAAELTVGVAVGIAVADLLIGFLGSGAWQIAVIAPLCRRRRADLHRLDVAAVRADYALRNTRVLARRAIAVLREGEALSPALPDRLDDLADAADLLRDELDRGVEPDDARTALLTTAASRCSRARGSPAASSWHSSARWCSICCRPPVHHGWTRPPPSRGSRPPDRNCRCPRASSAVGRY